MNILLRLLYCTSNYGTRQIARLQIIHSWQLGILKRLVGRFQVDLKILIGPGLGSVYLGT